MTGSTHAKQRSARSPRPTREGPARDNPIAGPRTGATRSEPSAPASAGASDRHNEPGSRPASACPAQPPSKAGGASPRGGKRNHGDRKTDWSTESDWTRRGAAHQRRGQEACQRGTPPARTMAPGQVPSHNGHRVPQTRAARTTHNEPRRRNRCQATVNPHTTHPSREWRGGAKTGARAHTPTTHSPARSGRVQEEHALQYTHTQEPQPGVVGRS